MEQTSKQGFIKETSNKSDIHIEWMSPTAEQTAKSTEQKVVIERKRKRRDEMPGRARKNT